MIPALVAACARWRGTVLVLALLAGGLSAWAVTARLGVTTDTGRLFSASLPWKQRSAVLQHAFPQGEDLLAVVIDSAVPEAAEDAARELAAALLADPMHFQEVRRPDALPYYERNAFLFLDPAPLRALLDQTVDAQPFLGVLAADPSLRGLCDALGRVAEGIRLGQANLDPFMPALRGFETALAEAAAGRPRPLSWQALLAGPLLEQAGRYRFVLAKPHLDYGVLQPGGTATAAIRAAAAGLEPVRSGLARVRITGSVALEDEEFATVAEGMTSGLAISMAGVAAWLFLAVGSWRLIVPILGTLVLGLLLTAGFAAVAVGTLNLVSVAFAILFVGIAVDFAIQFSVRFREARLDHRLIAEALRETGRRAGVQILVASLATAAGFLAFTPTAFAGVAQLGLIAGVGMLIALSCTLTVLPAALSLLRPRGEATEVGFRWARPLDRAILAGRRVLLVLFAGLALAGLASLPWLGFDSDPLHTKNPHTEAMRTLSDLMDDPVTNPYSIEILAPDLATAAGLATRIKALPAVDEVRYLNSFVPGDQPEKLAMIADAASILLPGLSAPPASPATPDALRESLRALHAALGPVLSRLPADHPLAGIDASAARLAEAPDAQIAATSVALTRYLPMQLDRLCVALAAKPVSLADIPPELRRDWVAPDGRPKLEVLPKAEMRGTVALHEFVRQVQGVAPEAAGSAVTIVRSADTITGAFRTAAAYAIAAIAAILFATLRRLLDTLLVLAALVSSSLLTVLLAVLLPLPLNFANVIALPLLLGVGVSFNIYFVMNWRAGQDHPLGSATARAVAFSALTTATAFGSLAMSGHPGTASMGLLLLLSLFCTVAVTFGFLPALLASVPRGAASRPGLARSRTHANPVDRG